MWLVVVLLRNKHSYFVFVLCLPLSFFGSVLAQTFFWSKLVMVTSLFTCMESFLDQLMSCNLSWFESNFPHLDHIWKLWITRYFIICNIFPSLLISHNCYQSLCFVYGVTVIFCEWQWYLPTVLIVFWESITVVTDKQMEHVSKNTATMKEIESRHLFAMKMLNYVVLL